MAPEEIEMMITRPMESAMNGLPGVRRIRSQTTQGLSSVVVEFDIETEFWRARQFVTERMAQVAGQLPPGTEPPTLSSATTRLAEVYEFAIEGDLPSDRDARDRRVAGALQPADRARRRRSAQHGRLHAAVPGHDRPEQADALQRATLPRSRRRSRAATRTPPAGSSAPARPSTPCAASAASTRSRTSAGHRGGRAKRRSALPARRRRR